MANINLATQDLDSGSENGGRSFGSGIWGIIIFFIMVLAGWAGLVFWKKTTVSRIEKIQGEYDLKYGSFTNSNAKDVVDFKNRLNFAKEAQGGSSDIKETLDKIETLMIPSEVWLGSYKYDEKAGAVILSCRARNYDLVARQILSFKKSEYFPYVSGGKTQMDKTTGVISFEVNLKLK